MIDACSWDSPGADPYRDPRGASAWIAAAPLSAPAKLELTDKAARGAYDDVVYIERDAIRSANPSIRKYDYSPALRHMAFGTAGKTCDPSRASWAPGFAQSGMVFCASTGECIVRPSVCNNWSILARLPGRSLTSGSAFQTPEAPVIADSTRPLLETRPEYTARATPFEPTPGVPGTETTPSWPVLLPPPLYPTPPIYVTPPVFVPVAPIPEPSTWALLLAGLAIVLTRRLRR